MAIMALPAISAASTATTAATAAKAAEAAKLAEAAKVAKAAQAAKVAQGTAQAAQAARGGMSMSQVMGPQAAQGGGIMGQFNPNTAQLAQGAAQAGAPMMPGQAIGGRPDFWGQVESTLGGGTPAPSSDGWEKGRRITEGFMQGGQTVADAFSNRTEDVIYPGRATNRWQANENPGLAGLMQQMTASFRGGFGRGIGQGR